MGNQFDRQTRHQPFKAPLGAEAAGEAGFQQSIADAQAQPARDHHAGRALRQRDIARNRAQRQAEPVNRGGGEAPKWRLSGGNARHAWTLEYAPGSDTAMLERSQQTPLAAFNRLHKGVGGGQWWILLADSFAVAMVFLGLSGIWMWARGRRPRELAMSVMGLSTLVFLAVVGLALL